MEASESCMFCPAFGQDTQAKEAKAAKVLQHPKLSLNQHGKKYIGSGEDAYVDVFA